VQSNPITQWGARSEEFDGAAWNVPGWISPAELARRIRDGLARAAAARSFPNHQGNYIKKRTPRPAGKPLTPRERFNRLAAHYLTCALTYRNWPRGSDRRALAGAMRNGRTVEHFNPNPANAK
jgi:hypothetical protein